VPGDRSGTTASTADNHTFPIAGLETWVTDLPSRFISIGHWQSKDWPNTMTDKFSDALAKTICSRQQQLSVGIAIFSILLLLMLVSQRVSEPGSATHVVATLNLYSLVVLIGVCGGLLAWCRYGRS
jgi:hypothetical protein